jgi:ribosome recycling factor
MPVDEIELAAEEKMEKALDVLRHELRMVRTGRATTALVEHVKVEVASYGSVMELRQLAAMSTPEGNMILIKPFDPGTIKDIHKALEKANIGITPMSDGKVIRLPIPPLSGERREQLAGQVKQMAETQRVAIRNIRRDANKHLDTEEKDSAITEDDAKQGKEDMQEMTDKYIGMIDESLANKIKEIQQV